MNTIHRWYKLTNANLLYLNTFFLKLPPSEINIQRDCVCNIYVTLTNLWIVPSINFNPRLRDYICYKIQYADGLNQSFKCHKTTTKNLKKWKIFLKQINCILSSWKQWEKVSKRYKTAIVRQLCESSKKNLSLDWVLFATLITSATNTNVQKLN